MRYFNVNPISKSLFLDKTSIPILNKDEILLKVAGFGLNRADILQKKGQYPPLPNSSSIIGLEAAGYICDSNLKPHRSKTYMALLKGGAYAEYVPVNKNHLMEVPDNFSIK